MDDCELDLMIARANGFADIRRNYIRLRESGVAYFVDVNDAYIRLGYHATITTMPDDVVRLVDEVRRLREIIPT